jgi:hypothetical protein
MRDNNVRCRLWGLVVTTVLLSACAGRSHWPGSSDNEDAAINIFPANYKADILAGMHAYLNDPTGIRDAAISQPMLKSAGNNTRYVVCVQFNGKLNGSSYAGVKELAAVFVAGRFDRFLERAQEQCAGVPYAPFPELEKLPR